MKGNVYVDGACYPHQIPDLCRAGWVVLQEGEGQECKVMFGPVWHPCHRQPRLLSGSLGL
eukprot:12501317-Heterocapsa_arctica.AAC.1